MKKMLALLCLLTFIPFCVSAESWRVFDNAGLFTPEETLAIEQAIWNFQRETKFDFAVLTTDDYLGTNSAEIAKAFFVSENLGFGQYGSGFLYYLAIHNGMLKPTISCSGEMRTVFDLSKRELALNACDVYIANGEYKNAVLKMIEAATEAFVENKEEG